MVIESSVMSQIILLGHHKTPHIIMKKMSKHALSLSKITRVDGNRSEIPHNLLHFSIILMITCFLGNALVFRMHKNTTAICNFNQALLQNAHVYAVQHSSEVFPVQKSHTL